MCRCCLVKVGWYGSLDNQYFLRIYLRMDRDSKKIVRRLLGDGFELVGISGSHHKFRKGSTTDVVPHPKKDLPLGTARAIAKQAGWLSRTLQ